MEGFDIGAIFSLFVAAFVLYQAVTDEGVAVKKLGLGLLRLATVALFAGLIAAHVLVSLVGTQIKGIVGTEQTQEAKAERWDFATQWSLPKREALGVLVPGLFGYRMDTPMQLPESLQKVYRGGNYWGAVGRDPAWDRYFESGKTDPVPRGFLRYTGGGIYAGVPVVLIALWALLQSFRKQNPVFSDQQRKHLWFWGGVALVSLLLGFGRHAPFYQFFYALPYASTIRNPAKFIHVLEWALVIIFAYGVHGLSRRYLETGAASARDLPSQLKAWWTKATGFEKRWVQGSAMALAGGLLGWLIYSSSRNGLQNYLQEVGFDATEATIIAGFSIRQVGWFILFLVLAMGLLTLILSGYFGGRRARLGGILLGVFLVADLVRANLPWVITYNYKEKYIEAADNPVINFLRQEPYKHRVSILPFQSPQLPLLTQVYQIEWMQHLFQYYNIQSLDIIQMPRLPADLASFEGALFFDRTTNTLHRITRRWELTNARYLFGPAGFLGALNKELDPQQQRFRPAMLFDFHQTRAGGPILARTNTTGPYALFDFTGALPRAKLYANWQVSTNDTATLARLADDPAFDPAQAVVVAEEISPPGPASLTNRDPGTVEFVTYKPKHLVLRAEAKAPSVLLLNDKYDPNWQVLVDNQPAALLRCNFIMRGVRLEPGTHTVEFLFRPAVNTLYVSLAAIALGLVLLGYVIFAGYRRPETPVETRPQARESPEVKARR